MQISSASKFKIVIITLGLLGCFLGFMGSSMASDLSSKNLLSVNIKPLIAYGATSLGVLGIFISYSGKKIGSYVLIASIILGLYSITFFFVGAAFFYLTSAIYGLKNMPKG